MEGPNIKKCISISKSVVGHIREWVREYEPPNQIRFADPIKSFLEEDGKKIARKGERPVHFGVVQAAATAPPAPQLGMTSKTRQKIDPRIW